MTRLVFISLILLMAWSSMLGQTVVRLAKPQQATEPIEAYTLFDESLPADIPNAIGTMGYYINGGSFPYSYQWLENETVIAEGELALIVPSINHSYYLRIRDSNSCEVLIPISISPSMPGEKSSMAHSETYNWKLTRNYLYLNGNLSTEQSVNIRLYDINGRLIHHQLIHAETTIPVNLSPGVYLIYSKLGDVNRVEKAIVE
ncbi:T9SS type A sorting domain-containing protein [Natronoflexus pectinivorans]|uniref:Putative secreted protein (Por secretion system target) n=1 Tax=Natronoflexus pectinivorans TaxID=682526 RepID=A0A4R2GD28_9BACT|nr:T9SS type A sorting domain-containing protein [Natronoflexus pectinivorans]TCO05988.1 putative secreted protein (Por secretion system target) [Natronoflexus pectinivorans]